MNPLINYFNSIAEVVGKTFFSDDIDKVKINNKKLYIALKDYLNGAGAITRSLPYQLKKILLPDFISQCIQTPG